MSWEDWTIPQPASFLDILRKGDAGDDMDKACKIVESLAEEFEHYGNSET